MRNRFRTVHPVLHYTGLILVVVGKKHDVVAIDEDQRVCETIYSETGAMTINGSATSLRTLKRAGADKADAVIISKSAFIKQAADFLTRRG